MEGNTNDNEKYYVRLDNYRLIDVRTIKTILCRGSYFSLIDPFGNDHVMKIYYNNCVESYNNSIWSSIFKYDMTMKNILIGLCNMFNYEKFKYKADRGNPDFKGIEDDLSIIIKKAKEVNHNIFVEDRIYKTNYCVVNHY